MTQSKNDNGCKSKCNRKHLTLRQRTILLTVFDRLYRTLGKDDFSFFTVFDRLYRTLGKDDFSFFFGTLLTDNGVEFNNPEGIEIDPKTHRKRSNVFLRYLTAEDTKLINSHINSYIRASNGGKSAYDVFVEAYGERGKRVLTRLNIERINPKDVILDPSLLRKPSD